GTGRVRWILDPIDGTVNYLYGLPQYAVSLAAELDGVVVAGVVRNAANGEEWTAVRGGGAYRAGRKLAGSAVTDLGQTLGATGSGAGPRRPARDPRRAARRPGRVRRRRRPVSRRSTAAGAGARRWRGVTQLGDLLVDLGLAAELLELAAERYVDHVVGALD